MRFCLIPTALLCLGLTMACGGGGSNSRPVTPTGNLTLRFGSDSFPGYSQAVVSLEKVEGSTDGANWTFLGNVKATYDLMALQNGHSAVILPATAVTATTYSQFRITWATVNYQSAINQPAYVVPSGGSGQILTMPITTVITGPVTVLANGSTLAQVMLSGQQAVQVRPGPTTTFQPTGNAYDLAAAAKLTGHLGDGATALSGVEVLAQTVDGLDVATLQRRAITDASGNYVLEALPTGAGYTYYVAAQPSNGTLAYAARASNPVTAATATTYTADLAFSSPQLSGALTLTITPASTATQTTWGELRQTLATGTTGSHHLIVCSQPAATSLVQDQVYFLGLAPGSFGVTSQRSSAGGAPVMKVGSTLSVASGSNVPAALSYP